MSVSVIVGTFGESRWAVRAQSALTSAHAQTVAPVEIIHVHGATLAAARNGGAAAATGDWLVFLDADDTLDQHYIEAMLAGTGDLRQPATVALSAAGWDDGAPALLPARPLITGNYLVIGTMVRRAMFHDVGGFGEWPCAEDWELWLRCWLTGAEIGAVPEAIYRIGGSGRNVGSQLQIDTFNRIRDLHLEAATRR